jgi:hypothetical protein
MSEWAGIFGLRKQTQMNEDLPPRRLPPDGLPLPSSQKSALAPHWRNRPAGTAKANPKVILCLALFISAGLLFAAAAEIPEISKKVGQVSLQGDVLRTGSKSRAQLKFPDSGLILRVGSNTILSGITKPCVMILARGVLLFSAPKGACKGVIRAGALTVRGSNFLISNAGGANKVVCLSGKTAIFATDSPRLRATLLQGEMMALPPAGETLTKLPRVIDIDLATLMATSMLGKAGGMDEFPNTGKKGGKGAGGAATSGGTSSTTPEANPATTAAAATSAAGAGGAAGTVPSGGTAAIAAVAPTVDTAAADSGGGDPPASIGIAAVSATAMTTMAIEQQQQLARQQAAIAQAEAAQQQAARFAAQQEAARAVQAAAQQLAAKAEAERIERARLEQARIQQEQDRARQQERGPQGNQGRGPQGNQGQGNQGQGNQGKHLGQLK